MANWETLTETAILAKTDPSQYAAVLAAMEPLVRQTAKSLCKNDSYAARMLLFADLESVGRIGVLEAIRRFDPDRGVKFQTACLYSIRGAILRFISTDCHPGLTYRHSSDKRYAKATIEIKTKTVSRIDDEICPGEFHDCEIETKETREEVDYALNYLDPDQAKMVRLRFGFDGYGERKYKDIAKEFSVSPERCRQIVKTAINLVANILQSRGSL